MAEILVTGGAGSMGQRLLLRLLAVGHTMRVLTLPGDPLAEAVRALDVDLRFGDVSDAASLAGLFEGIEVVYHLAAVILARDPVVLQRVNVEGTRNVLAGAQAAGVRQFIHISSASVVYPHTTPYSLTKRAGEALVREQPGLGWCIVRPTLVYGGPGCVELERFAAGLMRVPGLAPLVGWGNARKRPVHVDDLAEGLARLCGRTDLHGRTLAFSGGETLSLRALARAVLRSRGRRAVLLPVPVPLLRLAAWLLQHLQRDPLLTQSAITGVIQHADLDNRDACAALDWHPRGFHEGLGLLSH